jgi:hypothetical protein
MKERLVVLFFSSHDAMRSSKILKKAGLFQKIIQAPRHLSSDCGYSVLIHAGEAENVKTILTQAGVEFDRIADMKTNR